MRGEVFSHAGVHCGIFGLPGSQSVDVAVVHAECGGDEDGVVNLQIGCALFAGVRDVVGGDVLSALLDLACDGEEGLELVGDLRLMEVAFDLFDQAEVFGEVSGGCGSVAGLAEEAVVATGDVGRD